MPPWAVTVIGVNVLLPGLLVSCNVTVPLYAASNTPAAVVV